MDFEAYLHTLLSALVEPAVSLATPGKRVYWVFLLSSLVIAAVVFLASPPAGKRRSPASLLRHLFDRRVWLHRSSRLDYMLMLVKPLIHVVLFAPFLVSTVAVAVGVHAQLHRWLGPGQTSALSPGAAAALFTVVAFLADDFSRYLLHRWLHRVPWLWEIHKLHHSATVMTPFTFYRAHPLESFLMRLRGSVVIGATGGLFFHLFGPAVSVYEIAGVDAFVFAFNAAGANLRHSHVPLRYGRWLEHLFISPAQHQIHHSREPRHYDANYGIFLAVWDWLGGSLVLSRRGQRLVFGLRRQDRNHAETLVSSLVAPVVASTRVLVRPLRRKGSPDGRAGSVPPSGSAP